jgi:thiazole/oxazole-forming peptide maturase SagC family component
MKLKSLRVHVIESDDGVILRRGCSALKIAGDGAAEAIKKVLKKTIDGATHDEICELFAASAKPAVEELIERLIARRLLVREDSDSGVALKNETTLDIFYWHFGERANKAIERLKRSRIVILGVNYISRQLATSLSASGIHHFQLVDHPQLRNLALFDTAGELKSDQWSLMPPRSWGGACDFHSLDCLVATSDFGSLEAMREWNKLCIQHGRHFMPVVLKNMIGYIGPLVVPHETACFECLYARQNSLMRDPDSVRVVERDGFEGQNVVGFHPSMASILGDLAAFELTMFCSEVMPSRKVGELIEVSLLAKSMTVRNVLKVPRCPVCSPLTKRSSTSPHKSLLASTDTTE